MRISETDRNTQTICALATAHGLGAISVLRISGPQAATIVRRLSPFLPAQLESHKIYYGFMKEFEGERPLDEVLLSYFVNGRSFTGEETFEISCHGSEAIVNDILQELVKAGAVMARRGEFTSRAFMNGRLDLVQAESVLAMIESRSTRASQLALRQLRGEFSGTLRLLTDEMTWILAQLEANIDYAAEDIEIASANLLAEKLRAVKVETDRLLASYRQGRIVREGFEIALVGRPNAGKSSLLNALAGEDRAIVTEVAGTTRDFVEAQLAIDGYRVTIIDTAGLRETSDRVEKIGVERTLAKLRDVDMVLYVADGDLLDEERAFFDAIPWEKTLLLWNKSDLGEVAPEAALAPSLRVSALTGFGLEDVRQAIRQRLSMEVSEDNTLVSNLRHFEGLQILAKAISHSLPLVLEQESPDLIALELQSGLMALYEILGRTYDDQVMDKVFQEFCLGK